MPLAQCARCMAAAVTVDGAPVLSGAPMVSSVSEKSSKRPGRNVAAGRSASGTKPGWPSSFFAWQQKRLWSTVGFYDAVPKRPQ